MISISIPLLLFLVPSYVISEPVATKENAPHQVYLDVQDANTTWHLEALRALPLSTYQLSYERSKSDGARSRLGAIGPRVAELIPEAVDLVPKRTLPPLEKGGKPIIQYDVPVVNENMLFMYGIGATQEISQQVEKLGQRLQQHIQKLLNIHGEVAKLEHIVTRSSEDYDAEQMRIKAAAVEARIKKTQMDNQLFMAQAEIEYMAAQEQAEKAQIKRSEELSLQRLQKEDRAAKIRTADSMKRRLEAFKQAQANKQKTEEMMSKLQHERDLALQKASEEMKSKTAKTVADAKAEAERANEDVHLRRLRAEAEQRRQRNVAAIHAIASHVASSFQRMTTQPRDTLLLIGYVALLVAATFTAKEAAKLVRTLIESTLGKPKLIRETTRKTFSKKIISDVSQMFVVFIVHTIMRREKPPEICVEDEFKDVILPDDLKQRVISLATAARKVKENKAPHRHVILYGPPGTGKTLVARKLAHCIGMDYALMSGGDVSPLGSDAVTQIHNLFSWASLSSSRGVLLFIDEAEAFLANRRKHNMSEAAHNALNALLYNTGSERKDFMLVLATNRAEDLDPAILDRCDESLLFPLPDQHCRSLLLSLYFEKYLNKIAHRHCHVNNGSCKGTVKGFFKENVVHLEKIETTGYQFEDTVMNDHQLKETVNATKGFSGREIGKLMIALQGAMYSSLDMRLTAAQAEKIIEHKVLEHKEKQAMIGSNILSSAGLQERSKKRNLYNKTYKY